MMLCHAMTVLPVLEMTTAPVEGASALHSAACRVKSVTTMHAALNRDTV